MTRGSGSEAIDRRRAPMRGAYVIVEQPDIAASDLKRRRTVAEDPLDGEDIVADRQESPREALPQDVRRASVRDPAEPQTVGLAAELFAGANARRNVRRERCCLIDPAARAQPRSVWTVGTGRRRAPSARALPCRAGSATRRDPGHRRASRPARSNGSPRRVAVRRWSDLGAGLRTRRSHEKGAHLVVSERRHKDVGHLGVPSPPHGMER